MGGGTFRLIVSREPALISAIVLGNASATAAVLEDEARARTEREAKARAEADRVFAQEREEVARARARELRSQRVTAVPLLIAAYVAPAVVGFIQGGSHVGAGPILLGWLIGFGLGLSLRSLAAQATDADLGRKFSVLTGFGVYLAIGFILYLVSGSIASGLSSG